MDLDRAKQIIIDMAKVRAVSPQDVVNEYKKYQVGGTVTHFWPEQNEACRVVVAAA